MFLAAIDRPQFDDDNNTIFDGKTEIFPFVYRDPIAKIESPVRWKQGHALQ